MDLNNVKLDVKDQFIFYNRGIYFPKMIYIYIPVFCIRFIFISEKIE